MLFATDCNVATTFKRRLRSVRPVLDMRVYDSRARRRRFRMRQADDSLREATILRDADAQRGAVNRACYAMFYALLALLATKQLGTSRHSGTISLFDREFVKTGVFAPDLSKALHLAFGRRQIHGYFAVN